MRLNANKLGNINVNVSFNIVNKDISSRVLRYLPIRNWTTSTFRTSNINNETLGNFREQIQSKIIQNGEPGSKIVFSHFVSFRMIATNVADTDIISIFGGNTDAKNEEEEENKVSKFNI